MARALLLAGRQSSLEMLTAARAHLGLISCVHSSISGAGSLLRGALSARQRGAA
jgi:hypothetical protein